jgi:hypothetical protein
LQFSQSSSLLVHWTSETNPSTLPTLPRDWIVPDKPRPSRALRMEGGVDFHDKDWWLGSPIAVKLAAPIGPVLSGNFHLSYWAVGLHDGIAFGIKKKKKKTFNWAGNCPRFALIGLGRCSIKGRVSPWRWFTGVGGRWGLCVALTPAAAGSFPPPLRRGLGGSDPLLPPTPAGGITGRGRPASELPALDPRVPTLPAPRPRPCPSPHHGFGAEVGVLSGAAHAL